VGEAVFFIKKIWQIFSPKFPNDIPSRMMQNVFYPDVSPFEKNSITQKKVYSKKIKTKFLCFLGSDF